MQLPLQDLERQGKKHQHSTSCDSSGLTSRRILLSLLMFIILCFSTLQSLYGDIELYFNTD